MRIAIVGGGVSGNVAAYRLSSNHEVTLFEAGSYLGGHTNTVDVESDGQSIAVDTGFIVFNDRTYPNFIQILDELGVESQETQMTFSVSCADSGLEYRGADWGGLFAQRRNFLNFKFHGLLRSLLRFNKLGQSLLESGVESEETVREFLNRHRFSDYFARRYLMPMGAAVWSCPFEKFLDFPIQFIAEFFHNHGLLSVTNRPQWRVIKGGSREYVKKLSESWRDRIRLNTRVVAIERNDQTVKIRTENEDWEEFDHVVLACHADQALNILRNQATSTEREILSAFPYQPNVATLHTDTSTLPRCKRAWACWNYYNPPMDSQVHHDQAAATVTYNMNLLQSLNCSDVFCVTLNDDGRIAPEKIISQFNYHHPTFDLRQRPMQARQPELINRNRTSFCGAYWGSGFHEDGVKSALNVVDGLTDPDSRLRSIPTPSSSLPLAGGNE